MYKKRRVNRLTRRFFLNVTGNKGEEGAASTANNFDLLPIFLNM